MAITGIAAIAIKLGAPLLAELFKRKGGSSGKVAGKVIERLAGELGVEPTPAAIEREYANNPKAVSTVFENIETDLGAVAEAASKATISYHDLIKGDRDSLSLLNRIWRPVNGLLFGLEVATIVFVVCVKIYVGDVETLGAVKPLYAFLGTILGTHAGVVGVYVWRRTDEKRAGVA
ncbi:MAG: hypothetical protein COB78_05780 [Hyphomicrobiales bacterium]|nr:MAG: hypothetical protein COB78_05780 [Hyphomicrobiales bacterium]